MKSISLTLIIFSLFIGISFCQKSNLFFLPASGRGKCLDGSQAGFYFNPGKNNGSNKYFIFLEGGGRCSGDNMKNYLSSCYKRSKTQLGSSTQWATSYNFGKFLNNANDNPVMYDWNQIFVKYCDGNLYQGSSQPIQVKDQQLYFRGYDIMTELFDELINKFGMNNASVVVLSGGSAGALGAYYWNQYLRELLPSNITVLVAPDSGFFPHLNENPELEAQVLDLITNNRVDIIQPRGCPYINDRNQIYRCLYAETILELIPVPLFVVNSLYDEYSLKNILGVDCVTDTHSLQNCTAEDLNKAEDLRKQTLAFLKKVKQVQPQAGAWAISCILHVFLSGQQTYSGPNYSVPQNQSRTAAQALSKFILAHISPQSQETIPFEVDKVLYPNNIPCNGYTTNSQIQQS